VFGFAVDLRSGYPAVSVIAPASVNPGACTGLGAAAPCIIYRWQSAAPAAALSIYAWGNGDGTTGPRVSINTGSDQSVRPYTYATGAVLSLLRAKRLQGAVGFNPQWPAASGPASLPTLTPTRGDRAVMRQGDTAFRAITVTPSNTAAGVITWTDELGTTRGSGASITIDTVLMTALGPGEHVLTASVVNPQNGRYGETRVRLLVATSADNSDHDGDGLTYDQEITLGLDPGSADSDGDGLSDGAEVALSKNPLVADNDASASLPRRGAMVREVGTSPGLVVGDDGLSVTFTGELNPACVAHVAPFDDPVYSNSAVDGQERCRKRAIRANVGITPGEFRYFESERLGAQNDLRNIGHGVVAANAPIDPYCCFIDPSDPDYDPLVPYTGTPPSLAVNSVGGVFRRLQQISRESLDLDQTRFYGFAVDYTSSEPKVYIVGTDANGLMTVSSAVSGMGFAAAAPVMPMHYGHPYDGSGALARMNLGLQKFHYDTAAIKAVLDARTVNTSNFKPGVGAHSWKP
jgi:Bacterial TSP3 repeat